MNQTIENLKSTTFFGRRFTRKQIEEIQDIVKTYSNLSRRELGHTICELYNWVTPKGVNKIQSCLGALEELERHDIIVLPAKADNKKRGPQKKIIWTNKTEKQASINCSLDQIQPIRLEKVTEKEQVQQWNEYVDRYHYLGYKRPIGSHLRYYIIDRHERILGCLLFSFAVCSLSCRDQWIGWKTKARKKRLNLVINNNRFLIFPWVDIKNLASKALSSAAREVVQDWESHHGYRPVLLETFVDPSKFKGTCYQAANWQHIGITDGRQSQKKTNNKTTQKDVYVYPLEHNFRSTLIDGKKSSAKKQSSKTTKKKDNLSLDDPFVQLWQRIIGIVAQVADDFDQKWQKRKRTLNTLLLILFIFRLIFSKNKQGYGITIAELWDQCRRMNVPLPQPAPVAASALCAARAKLDENIFKTLNTKIINNYETQNIDDQWNQHRLFAVDGTKINLPRQLLDYGYRVPSDNAYYPQGLVSCLYQLKPKIPADFDLVAHKDERKIALTHLQALKQNDIVIYDRGYFSYVMLYRHIQRKIHVVFRLKSNTYKVINEFVESNDIERVVVIQPSEQNQTEILSKNPDIKFIPLQLRLIKYVISGTTYILGTTLIDGQKYKAEEFPDIYHSRWGIEELYKVSKVLIDIEDFHGQTERGVKQELFAHFNLITLSRIFANHTEDGMNLKENTDVPDNKFKVNLKNCLITISRNLECLFIQQATLIKKTINTIVSSISTCRQRQRANRSYKRQSRKPVGKWQPPKVRKSAQIQIQVVVG